MDLVLRNVRMATMEAGGRPYGEAACDAIGFEAGRIAWLGESSRAPAAAAVLEGRGRWLTPGLVDCHTHLVHAGHRAREFEMRLAGASYEEISRAGGGIRSTVRATRGASIEELVAQALPRLRRLMDDGVTAIEIKSGYGLDVESEVRMLRAARRLGEVAPVTVRTTLLALHAVPPEFAGKPDDYVDFACRELVPEAARLGLADAVDAFCERIAFSVEQTERIFRAAADHGLPVKIHAEQLSNQGGAALAARHGALSADHLEHLDEPGVEALARAKTVAVLLPGAFFFLREQRRPPVESLRRHGVRIALASDNNPGTSPYASLLLVLHMGCVLFGLTAEESLAAVTREGAAALGLQATHGTLAVGKWADAVLWDVDHPSELAYGFGVQRPATVFRHGAIRPGAHP
jgi:imidazolonepropionase